MLGDGEGVEHGVRPHLFLTEPKLGDSPLFSVRPSTGSGRTFWRTHLITGERGEFRCTQMRVRPDPLILGKEFADEAGGTESHPNGDLGSACARGQAGKLTR